MDPEPLERLPLVELIVEERRCRSLSLADVAALVRKSAEDEGKQSGATRQTVHNWERGQIPRPDSLRWLARALEAASAMGLQAAQIAHATGSARIGTELHRLRSSLTPWRDHPAVASLNRALAVPA